MCRTDLISVRFQRLQEVVENPSTLFVATRLLKELRELMCKATLEPRELSRGIIEMRDE